MLFHHDNAPAHNSAIATAKFGSIGAPLLLTLQNVLIFNEQGFSMFVGKPTNEAPKG